MVQRSKFWTRRSHLRNAGAMTAEQLAAIGKAHRQTPISADGVEDSHVILSEAKPACRLAVLSLPR
ncbi:MAG TPA: hypothetical protein VMD78_03135 [Candidatus Baltobacteraceae bacterium]|nr:hypothetical protein [Candidatus Baltobacteraceae bacterium]